MLSNFFRIAWRNILKRKTFSFINIFGLAIGLSSFLMIAMYVVDELSYDRFHENADRIYRVNSNVIFGGSELNLAVTADPMGAALKKDYPEVEQFTRIYNSQGAKQIRKGSDYINETSVAHADSTFFEVFTFPAIEGNTRGALNEPNTVVITERAALKYFGRTGVVGETIMVDENADKPYKVTAVIGNMPTNSHFNFDFLFSMDNVNYSFGSYLSHNFYTYLLLKPGTGTAAFNRHFTGYINRYVLPQASQLMDIKSMDDFKKAGNMLDYSLMPLKDIHLKSDRFPELSPSGNIRYIYIFGSVAVFILLLACVNFINLSTANSGSRAREIGIRKVLGSEKAGLVNQFLSESVLTAFLATLLSVAMVWASIGLFNDVSGKSLSILELLKPLPLAGMLLLCVVVGLLAGSYPAFYIAGFQPIAALKGKLRLSSHKSYFRNGLVIFQFATAMVLMIATTVVFKQLAFIRNKNLGFKKEQVLLLDNTYVLGNNFTAFKNKVLEMKGVTKVAQAGYLPVSNSSRSDNTFSKESVMTSSNSFNMQSWNIDYDYIPTLGMELVQGRNFSKDFGTDSSAIIINETCAEMLGGGNLIGRKLYSSSNAKDLDISYTVVGVVKNFNFESLRQSIGPLCMHLGNANWTMALKVETDDIAGLVGSIESSFKSLASGKPFSYRFLDESFNEMYRNELRMGKLALVFALLAIFIACLGLFGLATYMARQRIKEIGIRKILGAETFNLVQMLSADFVKLVMWASLIAFPLAGFVMFQWLQDFAYRTSLQWWVFALAAVAGLSIALLTVSFQAIKAAMANPVNSLRTE